MRVLMVPSWPAGDRLGHERIRVEGLPLQRGEPGAVAPSSCWCVGAASPLAVQPLQGILLSEYPPSLSLSLPANPDKRIEAEQSSFASRRNPQEYEH